MKQENSSRPRVITDPQQALFLTDAHLRQFITPFLGQSASVSQAANALRIKTNAMLYRVQQMLDLGLLEAAHLEKRPGRAIQHYKSVADSFFVPFTATPFENFETQIQHNEHLLHQEFARAYAANRWKSDNFGTLLSRIEPDHVNIALTQLEPEQQPQGFLPYSIWSTLSLKPEVAIELRQRVHDLLREYRNQPGDDDGDSYLLHFGFTSV
jgi:REP element-mobilizing transposase RayT